MILSLLNGIIPKKKENALEGLILLLVVKKEKGI